MNKKSQLADITSVYQYDHVMEYILQHDAMTDRSVIYAWTRMNIEVSCLIKNKFVKGKFDLSKTRKMVHGMCKTFLISTYAQGGFFVNVNHSAAGSALINIHVGVVMEILVKLVVVSSNLEHWY